MDENIRLILELTQRLETPPDHEPMLYDVQSLLAETRRRVYTAEGQRLVEGMQQAETLGHKSSGRTQSEAAREGA